MRKIGLAALSLGLALSFPFSALAEGGTKVSLILDRFRNANQWRDHVMVVAHRGGWKDEDRMAFAENSVGVIERAIGLGAEAVEIDVRKSKDGAYIVMHDSWLDRTTTCRGIVAEKTLAELKQCRLIVEGTGEITAEHVPTLREIFSVTKDRILVQIDNKLDSEELVGIVSLAREMGMVEQVIVKENLWNPQRVADARRLVAAMGNGYHFMPVIADDAVTDVGFIETAGGAFSADAVEMIHWLKPGLSLTENGGVLFGARSRAVAVRGDWHIWVNTYSIVNKAGGYIAGGRGDKLAVLADVPQEAYGFWVERGATIIHTDEPKAAIEWLNANGYRVSYDLTN